MDFRLSRWSHSGTRVSLPRSHFSQSLALGSFCGCLRE